MIRKTLILSTLLLTAVQASAGGWTGHKNITKLYPHGHSQGIYVQLEGDSVNPDGCKDTDLYFLGPDNAMQSEIYSLLLAANATKSKVNLYVLGCAQNRAAIMAAMQDS